MVFVYGYDANDRLTSRWTPARLTTTYSYDAVGNLTLIDYPANPNVVLAYDANNRLTSMSDEVGTTTYSYTSFGAVEAEDGPWPDDTVSFSHRNTRVPETLHPYVFANNNPKIYSDPSGEFTTIEFNIVGAIQKGINTAKVYGVNRGRRFAIKKLQEAITDLATQPLKNLLPINLGDIAQGFEFERVVREAVCGILPDATKYFYFEVGINGRGHPLGAGITCADIEDDRYEMDVGKARKGIRNRAGTAYAEMIIGPSAPKKRDQFPNSWVIAEIKRSTQAAYADYVGGRKAYQFDNYALYARKHTYSKTLVIIIGKRTPGNRYKTIEALLKWKGVKHRAIVAVDVIGGAGGKRKRR